MEDARSKMNHAIGLSRGIKCGDNYNCIEELSSTIGTDTLTDTTGTNTITNTGSTGTNTITNTASLVDPNAVTTEKSTSRKNKSKSNP